eukprot:TRINITY_DN16762_c0_g1_i3.p1 TRINITY_DN16762_c0_g1~~TRINITY_DN16762_c0_g1_i3.p1  ORF type:complete len:581 (+),score=122.18 TRINITY_DN16762_c0_g1_i3:92-1834(+)
MPLFVCLSLLYPRPSQGVKSSVTQLDAQQHRFERTLAELHGICKGVSDELQHHIRDVRQTETRALDERRQKNEQFLIRQEELDQEVRNLASVVRVSNSVGPDTSKKVSKLENLVDTLRPSLEDLSFRIADIEDRKQSNSDEVEAVLLARIEKLEATAAATRVAALAESPAAASASAEVSARLKQACSDIDQLLNDSRETQMQVEAQAERLKSLHTRIESLDGNQRKLTDRIMEVSSQNRLKEMQATDSAAATAPLADEIKDCVAKITSLQRDADKLQDLDNRLAEMKQESALPMEQLQGILGAMSMVAPKLAYLDSSNTEVNARLDKLQAQVSGAHGQNGHAPAMPMVSPQASLTSKGSKLIGFDFDCTLTVKHFFKIFAWGYMHSNLQAHPHCMDFFKWCEEHELGFEPIRQPDQHDPMNCALDHFCGLHGLETFHKLFREVLLGGEDRIRLVADWLQGMQDAGCEFCIVTAGTSSAVMRGLAAVPEWQQYFPSNRVWDTQQGRHAARRSVGGQKALMMRDIYPEAQKILFVDDALVKDPAPEWTLAAAGVHVFHGNLPYEGPGIHAGNLPHIKEQMLN